MKKVVVFVLGFVWQGLAGALYAATPVISIKSDHHFPPKVILAANGEAKIVYVLTNNSLRTHEISMLERPGLQQTFVDKHSCSTVPVLAYKQSCTLTLKVIAHVIGAQGLHGGPIFEATGNARFSGKSKIYSLWVR